MSSNAVNLANFLSGDTLTVDSANDRVGIASTTPTTTLEVSGVVKASSFSGDATGLTGLGSTDNIITGTASTFTGDVNISGITTVGLLTAYTSIKVGSNITADGASGSVSATSVEVGSATTINSTGVTLSGVVTATSLESTNLTVSGRCSGGFVGLGTTNANTTLDLSTGNNFSVTLTDNIILTNPSGSVVGQSGVILISQDGSGNRTCGFGSHWDFASSTPPVLSTGANALDAIGYIVRSSTSIVTNSLIGIGTL